MYEKNVFLASSSFTNNLEFHDETSKKMLEITKAYISLDILSSEVICPCSAAIYMYKIMKKSM